MSTFTIEAATPNDAGRYTVTVTNGYGVATSLDAFLVISTIQAPIAATVSVAAQSSVILQASGQNGNFVLTRTGNVSEALVVNFTVGGSAVPGVDYKALDGRATFKAGKDTKKIKIKPVDRGSRMAARSRSPSSCCPAAATRPATPPVRKSAFSGTDAAPCGGRSREW